MVNTERCKGCGLCVAVCPVGAVSLSPRRVNHKGYTFAEPCNEDACSGCASCAVVCPDACISVYRARVARGDKSVNGI